MSLKLTKFKGGRVGLKKQLYNLNKKIGSGTAAVKKLTEDEIKSMEQLELSGGSIRKPRSIKPLNFKI